MWQTSIFILLLSGAFYQSKQVAPDSRVPGTDNLIPASAILFADTSRPEEGTGDLKLDDLKNPFDSSKKVRPVTVVRKSIVRLGRATRARNKQKPGPADSARTLRPVTRQSGTGN